MLETLGILAGVISAIAGVVGAIYAVLTYHSRPKIKIRASIESRADLPIIFLDGSVKDQFSPHLVMTIYNSGSTPVTLRLDGVYLRRTWREWLMFRYPVKLGMEKLNPRYHQYEIPPGKEKEVKLVKIQDLRKEMHRLGMNRPLRIVVKSSNGYAFKDTIEITGKQENRDDRA